jgi:hypothetical protein
MKALFFILVLVMVSACGGKKDSSSSKPVVEVHDDTLTCEIEDVSPESPSIKIEKDTLAKIMRDLEGRPFSREEFWGHLSRDTRLELNLALNQQMKNWPEEFLYKGIVLYIEHLLTHPGQSFYLRTSARYVVFYSDAESWKVTGGDCKDQESAIAGVEISKVIRHSAFEKTLNCYGPRMHVELSLYKNAVIVKKYFDVYSFVGGELIRKEINGETRLQGLAPDQSTLNATISPGRVLEINLNGTSGSIAGTGMCD